MSKQVEFLRLCQYPQAMAAIANWYFTEWGHFRPDSTESDIVDNLQVYLQGEGLPQAIVAKTDSEPVGVAELKFHELSLYPQFEHWLGGVYVKPEYRANALGTELAKRALSLAVAHRVNEVYLQTVRLDGGLYAELGWEPVETFEHKGLKKLLMVNRLDPAVNPDDR